MEPEDVVGRGQGARDALLARARERAVARERRAGAARAAFARALPLAAVGMLGALPAPERPSSIALLAWLAFWSPVAGFLAGSQRLRAFAAASIPAAWMVAFVLVESAALGGDAARGVPAPAGAAMAWSGLFAAGFGLGRAAGPSRRWRGAGLVAAAAAALSGAALAFGLADAPWPAEVSARLLDASPVVLVVEAAGVADWMWHPSTYEAAGVDRYARAPYGAALAGPLALVVGCALAALGAALARGERAEQPG